MKLLDRCARGKKRYVVLACAAAYLAWPYVALYQIGNALQRGDVPALTADVEWDAVREGLKEDIADQIAVPPDVATTVDSLPPFGAGFMTGLAGNMVDRAVTPERLAQSRKSAHQGGDKLRSAWFTSPVRFEASIAVTPVTAALPLLRIEMALVRDGWAVQWRVTRVWVPAAMLQQWQAAAS